MPEQGDLVLVRSKCPQCGDEPHEPGQSKRSNCGEDELIRHAQGHHSEEMYTAASSYIPGNYYTRKGQPRREFRGGRRA